MFNVDHFRWKNKFPRKINSSSAPFSKQLQLLASISFWQTTVNVQGYDGPEALDSCDENDDHTDEENHDECESYDKEIPFGSDTRERSRTCWICVVRWTVRCVRVLSPFRTLLCHRLFWKGWSFALGTRFQTWLWTRISCIYQPKVVTSCWIVLIGNWTFHTAIDDTQTDTHTHVRVSGLPANMPAKVATHLCYI